MWQRFKQLPGLKSRTQDTVDQSSSQPSHSDMDVMGSLREQHPNMSVFNEDESERPMSPELSAAPAMTPLEAKGSRRFTLKAKKKDDDSVRIRSPSPGPHSAVLKKKSAVSLSSAYCC